MVCIRIPITIFVTGLPNLFQNTGILTIVLVVQINNIVAHFTILFIFIVFTKFVQTPRVLCKSRLNEVETAYPIFSHSRDIRGSQNLATPSVFWVFLAPCKYRPDGYWCMCMVLCWVQTELTSEEKRQTHQKELAEKLNEEARARLAGQKGKTDEKKSVSCICCLIHYCSSHYTSFPCRSGESK